jgi:DNA recombination protein RmuC
LRTLTTATEDLKERTTVLSTTLKGSAGKGRWGEVALRNVVEIAGLTEHVDFEEQPTTEDGTRPDMTVNLPGDRIIAIDAKAPVNAFLEAQEATDDKARQAALARHVREIKGHIRTLASRDYAGSLTGEVDLVVMFLPSEALLTDAYSREPDLQLDALRSRVLLATPTTLVALLRTVAIYWQQRALAENAAEIASVAGMLYERAAKFGEELSGVGRSMEAALESYNRAVGSFDHRLMPMARRLEEMKVAETTRRKVTAPATVDEQLRLPRNRPSSPRATPQSEHEGHPAELEDSGDVEHTEPS